MSGHVLSDNHPMRPIRLQYTYALLRGYGAFEDPRGIVVKPRAATLEELATFHEEFYLEIVSKLSAGEQVAGAELFGFSERGDNPIYAGMYEAALLSTGASVRGAELVADGTVSVAFAPAGGLHHAAADHASGFCIFNDPVIAINALRKRGKRVVYIDIDAHHGDGVQAAFYGDNDVMTISLHESGRWLFPGTGDVDEIGTGDGIGYSVNVPLFPYTPDDVYLEAFDAVVPPLVEAFAPDVIATQLGVDTYVHDPLTHLALTTHGYMAAVQRLGAMGYPWLAFGGGGYDLDAVARCWTLAYGLMLGREWPDELPEGSEGFLESGRLRDGNVTVEDAVDAETRSFARQQVERLKHLVFPLHGIDV
jgi:acetoin utilization protein AcuC